MLMREGVILDGLQPEMRHVKRIAKKLWKKNGKECVIVSGLDREHSAGSLHPFGYALDLRTNYFGKEQAQAIGRELQSELKSISERFGVVVESDHIHVQFKPKGV